MTPFFLLSVAPITQYNAQLSVHGQDLQKQS